MQRIYIYRIVFIECYSRVWCEFKDTIVDTVYTLKIQFQHTPNIFDCGRKNYFPCNVTVFSHNVPKGSLAWCTMLCGGEVLKDEPFFVSRRIGKHSQSNTFTIGLFFLLLHFGQTLLWSERGLKKKNTQVISFLFYNRPRLSQFSSCCYCVLSQFSGCCYCVRNSVGQPTHHLPIQCVTQEETMRMQNLHWHLALCCHCHYCHLCCAHCHHHSHHAMNHLPHCQYCFVDVRLLPLSALFPQYHSHFPHW
jgi:hypothetical protein